MWSLVCLWLQFLLFWPYLAQTWCCHQHKLKHMGSIFCLYWCVTEMVLRPPLTLFLRGGCLFSCEMHIHYWQLKLGMKSNGIPRRSAPYALSFESKQNKSHCLNDQFLLKPSMVFRPHLKLETNSQCYNLMVRTVLFIYRQQGNHFFQIKITPLIPVFPLLPELCVTEQLCHHKGKPDNWLLGFGNTERCRIWNCSKSICVCCLGVYMDGLNAEDQFPVCGQ